VDAHGNKFESIAELIAQEKAARAARRGGGVEVQEEEVRTAKHCVVHLELKVVLC
jgi:hypothetical protein